MPVCYLTWLVLEEHLVKETGFLHFWDRNTSLRNRLLRIEDNIVAFLFGKETGHLNKQANRVFFN